MVLRKGRWKSEQIVPEAYLERATHEARSDNPAYGYLWWLNRGASHQLPYAKRTIGTRLFPKSPVDAFAALGAKDSKIFIVPSLDLVVTRLGKDAYARGGVAPTRFDDGLLSRICAAVGD